MISGLEKISNCTQGFSSMEQKRGLSTLAGTTSCNGQDLLHIPKAAEITAGWQKFPVK